MRLLFLMMNELSCRLDVRTRRLLLMGCMAGLSFFARSTALAWHDGDPIDAVAGFVLLLLFATGAAVAAPAAPAMAEGPLAGDRKNEPGRKGRSGIEINLLRVALCANQE